MAVGDVCLAFDGTGSEARCIVKRLNKRSVELSVVERLDSNRELQSRVTLVVALPKGDRQKTLVDFLVQLGVHALQPLVTKRGVAQPVDSALVRLRRSVIESSKQCGRNRLMEIAAPIAVTQLAMEPANPTCLRMFAHPCGETVSLKHVAELQSIPNDVIVLIGPEGGFTDEEAGSLRAAGWIAVSLGSRILRVEVAAVHVASYLAASLDR